MITSRFAPNSRFSLSLTSPVPISFMSDPLAVQLNDLATANSDGLLNEEEYRLLRQNLFERYAGGTEVPSVNTSFSLKPRTIEPTLKRVEFVQQTPSRPPHHRSKLSGVALLLRRAASRKAVPGPSSPHNVIRLNLFPRVFSKRRAGESLDKPRSSAEMKGASSPTRLPQPKDKFDISMASPSRSAYATRPSNDVIPQVNVDTFDDSNLHTVEDIQKAIYIVEEESRRLIAAFNNLETSAVIRYRQLHSSSPASNHRPQPSLSHSRSTVYHMSPRSTSVPDTQSVRSSSSLRTTKSTASLFQSAEAPPSSLPRTTTQITRKGSISSLSSSFLSVGRSAVAGLSHNRSVSHASHSATHLPLRTAGTMMEILNPNTPLGEGGGELADVRRRRQEVMDRCEARLSFLRAKLKSIELRAKLMRH
ncbi:unnamed protein product [Mycena citricolor]|uniref:Uncharacterized protein n=1 Tax=Mycena citricolor TaxID=2018698 RepID=A0AAD2H246_9AGAR|nr:unnamed protein product [Mycena citricolor]